MTTNNDDQERYGPRQLEDGTYATQPVPDGAEKPKRDSLLSDEQIDSWASSDWLRYGAKIARDFYEEKIASGELMVVKTARLIYIESHCGIDEFRCSGCGREHDTILENESDSKGINYCPGCGAKIIDDSPPTRPELPDRKP